VITAGGYRISPLEVETILNQHPSVEESAVVEQSIEPGKTIVEAFVILKPGFKANQDASRELQDFTAQKLAKYKVPRQIIFLKELPKTQSSKLKRKELKKL
jgi:acetyl-CoA synthetase